MEEIVVMFVGGGIRYLFFKVLGCKISFTDLTTGKTQERINGLITLLVVLLIGALIAYILN